MEWEHMQEGNMLNVQKNERESIMKFSWVQMLKVLIWYTTLLMAQSTEQLQENSFYYIEKLLPLN